MRSVQRTVLISLMGLIIAACSSTPDPKYTELPPGDVTRGATLFKTSINGAPTCASCHSLAGDVITGPSMKGFSTTAGNRVSGLTAGDYALQSILHPPAYIVSGFSNSMYIQYGDKLNRDQLADLIAYLLTL